MFNYIHSNPRAFGEASGYRDLYEVRVVHSRGEMSIHDFRNQYLSNTIISKIIVKGVGVTEAEMVQKVAEMVDKLL